MEDKARSGRRTYDSGFKERAVAMAAESNNVAETARQLGVGYSLLNSWRNAAELARSKGQGLAMALEERARLAALEKEVAQLREENEILKKGSSDIRVGGIAPDQSLGRVDVRILSLR
ncbi:MAG: transposase [Fibrobacteria bacterium]|nr:transposase [Fibrobacteria bacterium]